MSTATKIETPSQIGPYQIVGSIGQGGMGVVYHGRHQETQQSAAIKTVRVADPNELFSIRREIHALTRLRHRSIVKFLDEGLDEGRPWYAMELLEGRTLNHFRDEIATDILRSGPSGGSHSGEFDTDRGSSRHAKGTDVTSAIDDANDEWQSETVDLSQLGRPLTKHFDEIVQLIRRLCAPLAFMHGEGIVHRDLKPDNVFLRSDNQPILMDFGLVSSFASSMGREILQRAGDAAGTPAYMAPEQFLGEVVDARADLYSLGCMLFELVTGRQPFTATTRKEVRRQHLHRLPTPPAELAEGLPKEVNELILRLLAKEPRERIGHAEDVSELLSEFDRNDSTAVQIDTRPYLYRPRVTGRSEIGSRLKIRLEETVRGRGGFVLLGGESGVGKTFLATDVARQARRGGMQVIIGGCMTVANVKEDAEDRADVRAGLLHPLRPLLQAVADRCVSEGASATNRLLGPAAKVLAPHEPALTQLPGFGESADPADLPPEEARQRLLAALKETLSRLAEEQPLLLLLDDLQWADELTTRFLLSLDETFYQNRSILLLGTYRSDEQTDELRELASATGVTEHRLERLGSNSISEMVADMLALPEPPADLVQYLDRHSEGNPFFVAEYLRTAVLAGLLTRKCGRWTIQSKDESQQASYESLPLPSSLKELVAHRIDGLSDGARRLAEQASVLGRDFEVQLLLDASGMTDQLAFEALSELVERQIFEQQSGRRINFLHDKVREVAYEEIDQRRRRELHATAAAAIERRYLGATDEALHYPELAHHWRIADKPEKTLHYLGLAGEQAYRAAASEEARQYLVEARELHEQLGSPGGNLRPARWERQIGEAYSGVDERLCRSHAKRALGLLGYPVPFRRLALARSVMIEVVAQLWHRAIGNRIPIFRKTDPEILAEGAYSYELLFKAIHADGDSLSILYVTLRSLNLADRGAPAKAKAMAYGLAQVMAGSASMPSLAQQYGGLARRALESTDDGDARAWVSLTTAIYYSCQGPWEKAIEHAEEALRIAEDVGLRGRWAEAATTLRNAYNTAARFADAEAVDTLLCESDNGVTRFRIWGHTNRAIIKTLFGRLGDAEADIRAARAIAPSYQEPVDEIVLRTTISLVALAQGKYEQSRVEIESVVGKFDGLAATLFEVSSHVAIVTRIYIALIFLRVYDSDEDREQMLSVARKLCRRERSYARSLPPLRPMVLNNRGDLAWILGHRRRALRLWKQAIRVAVKYRLPFQEAEARLSLAQGLTVEHDRSQQVTTAKNILQQLGMRPNDILRLHGKELLK